MGQRGRGWDRELPEGFEERCNNGNKHPVPRCWARSKKTGEQCKQPAASGQKVCRYHGANAKQNIAKGKERVAERKAATLVATYGLRIETTATEALLDEVQWTAGHVAWLRERVQEIETAALIESGDADSDTPGMPPSKPPPISGSSSTSKNGRTSSRCANPRSAPASKNAASVSQRNKGN